MKISEMIEALQAIKDANGDLDVETSSFCGDRVAQGQPTLDHRAVLNKRESKPRFASEFKYGRGGMEGRAGEPVCRL